HAAAPDRPAGPSLRCARRRRAGGGAAGASAALGAGLAAARRGRDGPVTTGPVRGRKRPARGMGSSRSVLRTRRLARDHQRRAGGAITQRGTGRRGCRGGTYLLVARAARTALHATSRAASAR